MKIIRIDENYYCIAKKDIEYSLLIDKFLELSKVRKNSFAEKYLRKIYYCVFSGYINIEEIYTKYYIDEYKSIEEYLYQRELLDYKDIKKITRNYNENNTIFKLNISSNSYNIFQYFKYNGYLIKEFNTLIGGLDE